MTTKLSGILAAVSTPFTADDQVDEGRLRDHVDFLIDNGLHGLVPGGSTGVQTMATISSYSILEAMRLDKANALLGRYDGTVTASSCPDPGTSLATYQINAWCVQLGKALGAVSSTQGTVACKAVGTCEVKVQFDNSKATGGSSTQTVVTEAAL